ncbi:hypothetical protein NEOLEDRAFT_1159494 [Neolentinus lepideus HHB14362 ss-1]|uniref:Prokaryotic-type class I peptide chain release factors domain-containing protein n=1 Tax=Neolentinus lepideus HHB14362 ss-1 TaxID=1314782 RepID=A0A165MFS8_9AGAM|nr:hypothetical protein NEOLEDRAFT_1159494 [Neolentinus lepideus HHB14362 ss-1]
MSLLTSSNCELVIRVLKRSPVSPPPHRFFPRYSHSLPKPPNLQALETPSDMQSARDWAGKFKEQCIPKSVVDLTFARSSGPGGQNVNKVNTKASVRCSIKDSWIPQWSHKALRASLSKPYYVASSDTIHVTSTVHRSQSQNVDDCLSKLHNVIMEAGIKAIKTEPSEAQKERVRQLQVKAERRRREEKTYLKRKRESRNAGRGGWD